MMNTRWETVSTEIGNAQRVRHLIEQDRQDQDEGRAQERAQDRAEAADDHHEQQLERPVDVEGQRLPGAEIDEGPERTGDADHERGHGKGRELGIERPDAHQLGGDIHVADRHPLPAEVAAHEVLGDESEDRHEQQAQQIALDGACARPGRRS